MDEDAERDAFTAALTRDPLAAVLLGLAIVLAVLLFAGVVFARRGNLQFLEGVLALTAAFAIVGAVVGLVRGLRSGSASRRRSA